MSDQTGKSPFDARFQEFLDAISECFITRDFSAWNDRIILPFSMITKNGPQVFDTTEALRENFEQYLTACDILRIDMVVRTQISLDQTHDGTWIGTYETNLLCDGKRATAPYTSSALLEDTPDGYKMHSILNARGHSDWTGSPK